MKRINEIFYSLQGEGRHTGRPAVFVRFSGCNLKCNFCDTDFSEYREMTDEEILAALSQYPSHFVVLTGGEPTLQVDDALVALLHANGYEVAMESNGTKEPPAGIDWLTVSPKGRIVVKRCQELKVLFKDSPMIDIDTIDVSADYYYLQPCDIGDDAENRQIMQRCIDYIKLHPQWRLSLQTHKLIGFK